MPSGDDRELVEKVRVALAPTVEDLFKVVIKRTSDGYEVRLGTLDTFNIRSLYHSNLEYGTSMTVIHLKRREEKIDESDE